MPIQNATSPTVTFDGLPCFSPFSSKDGLTPVKSNCVSTCSLDQIPSPLLQNISHDILPFLTTLINSSLTSGIIQAPFKTATVKALRKKPPLDSDDIRNYRPVSLLSFFSKTLERVVDIQLSSYLSENYLLDSNQSGLRTGHSTETALLTVTESLGAARASSNSSVMIRVRITQWLSGSPIFRSSLPD